ncbi:MAG: ABC transporter permease subunit [Chlorobi bacterium]|nr:ABC transporter permease subunit [Chlorobiota bacterium]
MNNVWTISKLTFREAFSRKIFLFFAGISTFLLLVFLAVFLFTDVAALFGSVKINGKELSGSNPAVAAIKLFILNPLYGFGLFLAIFSSASFIPHMLEKGNIDLLLSKPISRRQLILGKFFGGVAVVFVNVFYLVFGLWLMIGYGLGDWSVDFLLASLVITFVFALLYSLMILLGIVSRSSVLAMMISYLVFLILSPVLSSREIISTFLNSEIFSAVMNFFYYVVPQTSDLGSILNSIALGNPIESYSPIIVSLAFIVAAIEFSVFVFSKKDY